MKQILIVGGVGGLGALVRQLLDENLQVVVAGKSRTDEDRVLHSYVIGEHWAEKERAGTFAAVLSIVARRVVPCEAHYSATSPLLSAALRLLFHSSKYDLGTSGDIFGVFHLYTEYDPFEAIRLPHMDPSQYSRDKTIEPFVRRALQ
jgi:hypothetical protein